MGHIFDALQRAEAERSGVELDAFDMPAELLQIAESAQSAAQKTAASQKQVAEPETPQSASRFADPQNPFGNFESLPVSLPPYRLVTIRDKGSLAAEKFRFLAVRLRHLQQRRTLKKLVITSTMPEEGKSTVAMNLACTLASRRQQKTLLLEGDLRRPVLRDQLGIGEVPGLSDYLQGTTGASLPVYRVDLLGIWILPAGGIGQNPLELMQGNKLSALIEQLSSWFEWIIIDTPPVLPLGDTSIWMRQADGILLVTRQGTTEKSQLKRGLETIESAKLVGALVNGSTNAVGNYYYYHRNPAADSSK